MKVLCGKRRAGPWDKLGPSHPSSHPEINGPPPVAGCWSGCPRRTPCPIGDGAERAPTEPHNHVAADRKPSQHCGLGSAARAGAAGGNELRASGLAGCQPQGGSDRPARVRRQVCAVAVAAAVSQQPPGGWGGRCSLGRTGPEAGGPSIHAAQRLREPRAPPHTCPQTRHRETCLRAVLSLGSLRPSEDLVSRGQLRRSLPTPLLRHQDTRKVSGVREF